MLDQARPTMALYVGGMGARGQNFYNDVARAYGYEKEAEIVQDLYLLGRKDEAAAAIPQAHRQGTTPYGGVMHNPPTRTLCTLFQRTAQAFPGKVALRTPNDSLAYTWAEYAEHVQEISEGRT